MPFPTYAKKEEIPAGAEDVYEEKDGKWTPKLEDTAGLKASLKVVRTEKETAEKLAREETEKAAALQRQLDAKNAAGGDTDKKIADMLTKWESDKNTAVEAATKPLRDQLADQGGKLRTILLDDKLQQAFIGQGGRPEKAKQAVMLSKGRFDLVDDRLVMKDDAGQVTTTTADDYFKNAFKAQDPEYYKGSQGSGGGAGGGGGANGGGPGKLTAEQVLANPGLAFATADAAK